MIDYRGRRRNAIAVLLYGVFAVWMTYVVLVLNTDLFGDGAPFFGVIGVSGLVCLILHALVWWVITSVILIRRVVKEYFYGDK